MKDKEPFPGQQHKLYDENDNGETLRFSPDDGVIVLVYRTYYDGAPTYHFDLYKGKDGSGYFLGSRCGGGSIYYTLHIAPYENGSANGLNRNYLFPADIGEEPFVRQMELKGGDASGMIDYTYKSGATRQKDTSEEENWWPDWPEELK